MSKSKELLKKVEESNTISENGPYSKMMDSVIKDTSFTPEERGFLNYALAEMNKGEDEKDSIEKAIELARKEKGVANTIRIFKMEEFFKHNSLGGM